MAQSGELILPDVAATERVGRQCAAALLAARPARLVVYLEGDLGAGKTSLVRGLLAGLGYTGRVPSPTYTLVEPYAVAGYRVQHVDLYRLRDPREVEDLGLLEQLGDGTIGLIEWPGQGEGQLPGADLHLRLEMAGGGRRLAWAAASPAGEALGRQLARTVPGDPALSPVPGSA